MLPILRVIRFNRREQLLFSVINLDNLVILFQYLIKSSLLFPKVAGAQALQSIFPLMSHSHIYEEFRHAEPNTHLNSSSETIPSDITPGSGAAAYKSYQNSLPY